MNHLVLLFLLYIFCGKKQVFFLTLFPSPSERGKTTVPSLKEKVEMRKIIL